MFYNKLYIYIYIYNWYLRLGVCVHSSHTHTHSHVVKQYYVITKNIILDEFSGTDLNIKSYLPKDAFVG